MSNDTFEIMNDPFEILNDPLRMIADISLNESSGTEWFQS